MKKIIFVVVIAFISCSPKIIPLKGGYPTLPIEITSEKSFEQVWDKLIDVFAQQGLSIKIIDKSSGLIVSDRSLLHVTIEKKDGSLLDSTAFIAVPKQINQGTGKPEPISGMFVNPYTKKLQPSSIVGEWNVRVKKIENGCLINVNIVNVKLDQPIDTKKSIPYIAYKSTGVFEKALANQIK